MSKLRPESVYIKHLKGLIQTLFLGFFFGLVLCYLIKLLYSGN